MKTSSRKVKSHVMESQIILLSWPYLNHLHKSMAQLITWAFLVIQSVSFTSAAFGAFAKADLCFLVSTLANKNVEVIKFLEILIKCVSENKIFHSRKKSNVSLNKKVIFVFPKRFRLLTVLSTHRCLCSHFILFRSLISVPKKCNLEKMLTFPYLTIGKN